MSPDTPAHIEPSRHSTEEVDEFLRHVEANVDDSKGAGSPAIKPIKELSDDGKPDNDLPRNPKT
jgi:hypothetical protein